MTRSPLLLPDPRLILNRRKFLTFGTTTAAAGLSAMATGCLNVPVDGNNQDRSTAPNLQGETVNTSWELKAADLRARGLYTTRDPGRWVGKENGHTPQLTLSDAGDTASVVVSHPMNEADPHWVTAIWVEDQNGVVIGLQEFAAYDVAAQAQFSVPAGTTSLTAYAHCNLHDTWKSLPQTTSRSVANPEWEAMAQLLEGAGVYSTQAPGIWAGKEGSHVPIAEVLNGSVTVRTEHPMVDEHRTAAIWIRVDGVVTGFQTFHKPATDPTVTFPLPVGATQMIAFAYCNQHDTWRSDPVTLA